MTDPVPEKGEDASDPLIELSIERVERDGGRYLIYYSWPHGPTDESTGMEEETRGAPDV